MGNIRTCGLVHKLSQYLHNAASSKLNSQPLGPTLTLTLALTLALTLTLAVTLALALTLTAGLPSQSPHSDKRSTVTQHTCSMLCSKAGSTSFTVRSTRTPPTIRKHRLPGSTFFRAPITRLEGRGGEGRGGEGRGGEGDRGND